MDVNYKNFFKSVKILYVVEEGVEHDYHVMPFELMCERIHITDFKSGWKEYLDIQPNIVMMHVVSNFHWCEDLIYNIHKTRTKSAFLILAAESLRNTILQSSCTDTSKVIFLPITFEGMAMALKEIVDSDNITYYINEKISFEPSNSLLIYDEREIGLTSKENKLLTCLLHNSHRIVTYDEIENCVWENNEGSRNALTTIISNIRKKVNHHNFIENYSNQGYKVTVRQVRYNAAN